MTDGIKRAVEAATREWIARPNEVSAIRMKHALSAALPLVGVEREDAARAICNSHDGRDYDALAEFAKDWWRTSADAVLALPHTGQPTDKDKLIEKLHAIAKNVSNALMSFTPGGSEYFTRVQVGDFEDYYADADVCQRRVRERIDNAEGRARAKHTGQPQESLGGCGLETIQTLLDLLNPLHGSLDEQTYDEKLKQNFDAPREAEYAVNVTAQQEHDLTQAVLILEDRKQAAKSRAAPQAGCAKEGWQADTEKAIAALENSAETLLLVDGDRDHINRSRLTCEQVQAAAKLMQSVARHLSVSPPPPVAESGWQEIESAPEKPLARFMVNHIVFGPCIAFWSENPRGLLHVQPLREWTQGDREQGYGHTAWVSIWSRKAYPTAPRFVESEIDLWCALPAPPLLAEQGKKS